MQNLDFPNVDLINSTDLQLSSLPDIEVEFDWDEALENLESENAEEVKKEETPKPTTSTPQCIYEKLKNLYIEQKAKKRILPHMHTTSHLLEKLIQRENFNMAVLSLYPYNRGYALGFCTAEGQIFQESRYPYSQDMLLDYVDREELPSPLLQYWDQTFPQMFYTGCVIMKIRDYRFTMEPQICHVLLKPHTQSIINDINLILLSQNQVLSMEDKISVESTIVNTVQNPLCLDPSVKTGLQRLKSHSAKNVLNTQPIRNAAYRSSQLFLAKKRRAEDLSSNLNKNLNFFVNRKKRQDILRCEPMSSPAFKELDGFISCNDLESDFKDVSQLARPICLPIDDNEVDHSPKLVEKYILEPERQTVKHEQQSFKREQDYQIKVEILQRPANSEYIGTLHVDKDSKEGENPSKCSFTLGSEANASKYIEHFTDIFTKEGGTSVRITHIVPGQPARETCTTAGVERDSRNQARKQNSAKTFMQIGTNTTIANYQQAALRTNAKMSLALQQLQQQNALGRVITTEALLTQNSLLSRLARSALPNPQSLNFPRGPPPRQKFVARKMAINNTKTRPMPNNSSGSSIRVPISTSNQKVQEQILVRPEISIPINMGNVNMNITNHSLINNVNASSLKGFKSGVLRSVQTVAGSLENPTALQSSVGFPAVHLIATPKEKTNGQTTTSSLSLSLPSLTALLADSSQLLKKNNSSIDQNQ